MACHGYFDWALAISLVVGCGGKAVIDPTDGAAGSGNTSGTTTTSTTSATTTTTTATTTGAGGASQDACGTACAAMSTSPWCGADGSCVGVCQAALGDAGACAGEVEAALDCIGAEAEATNCWFEGTCQPAIAAWGDCLGYPGACGTIVGSGDPQDCKSAMTCGNTSFEVSCSYFDLAVDCQCRIDGLPVGRCSGGIGGNPCDPLQGCCAGYF